MISGNTVSGCVEGIIAHNITVITGNHVSNNSDTGVQSGVDCLISGNNVSDNGGVGVTSDIRTLFLNNVANFNGNFGIHANGGSSAIGNLTDGNVSSGLFVSCPSKIADNTAIGNGALNLSESGVGCLNTNTSPRERFCNIAWSTPRGARWPQYYVRRFSHPDYFRPGMLPATATNASRLDVPGAASIRPSLRQTVLARSSPLSTLF